MLEEALLSGFLNKQGEKGPIKGWKKRWFIISPDAPTFIRYQKKVSDTEELGQINLETVTEVKASQKNEKLSEWAFNIDTPTRRYNLMAPDEETMNYWIQGVQKVLSDIKDGGVGSPTLGSGFDPSVPRGGQLFVNIIEAQKINLSKDLGHLGVYCVLSIDKQLVRTQVVDDFKNLRWNEGFFFDVTGMEVANKTRDLTLGVWVKDLSESSGQLIGELTVPVASLYHQKPIDQFLKLRKSIDKDADRSYGELRVKLLFTEVTTPVTKSDFNINKVVGRGNFGKVMQVTKQDTGRIYAMKVLRKDTIVAADAVRHTLSETNVLRRVNHPFIVGLKYSFQTPDKLYMVMDYLSGGELFYHLSNVDRFDENRARFYAAEIIDALGYLHSIGVVYRDLKPENLLLDISGHVCLTDFGLVKEGMSFGDVTHTFCGSPEYLAPEILQGKGYSREVDWWAMGTFLYEMLEGLPPFYDEDISEMNKRILHAPLHFDPENFSPEAKSLLRGLLQRDPKKRLGSGKRGVLDIKEHAFFRSIDWEKLFRRELEPAFKPHLQSAGDVRYFDEEFTSQTPTDSFVDTSFTGKADLFSGFTYVPTSAVKSQQTQQTQQPVRRRKRGNTNTKDIPVISKGV